MIMTVKMILLED